jgi:hypothetical protein
VNEFWFQTRPRSLPRPVVVLDVSAAAAPLWPVLLSTAEGLAEALPGPARPDAAFLGGSERFPLDQFLAHVDRLHAANAGRGRVVSPLLESFRGAWPGRVVVLAARPVVDLPDWRHTPFVRRLTVVRLDPAVPVADGVFPEADLTDIAAVAALIDQPPLAVRVRVPGGIPVAWDNPAFRFAGGQLEADPGAETAVRAGFLCPSEPPAAVAEVARGDGTADPLPVGPADPPEPPPWLPLTAAELTLLHSWQAGRPAHCPRCGADHEPGAVACPTGGGVLLPSLARLPAGAFIRLRVRMFQASYQPVPSPVLWVGESAVVVRPPDGPATVWRFDTDRDGWHPTSEPWGPFERLDGDEFALMLPGRRGTT